MERLTTAEARALLASEGAQSIYFPPDGAGNVYHDAAARLPDGSVIVLACVEPRTRCHYEGRLYSPGEYIAQRNRPTPTGIYGGRHSDWMDHARQCGERALSLGATPEEIRRIWGYDPPTVADVVAQRARRAAMRLGSFG